MFDNLIKKFVASSVNPEAVSMSMKGLLLANIGIIMFILNYFDVPYTPEEVTNVIGLVSGLVGSVLLTVGIVRKLVVAFSQKTSK